MLAVSTWLSALQIGVQEPIVMESTTSPVVNRGVNVTGRTVASLVPPVVGSWPVSAKVVVTGAGGGVVKSTPIALPLKVVVAVDVALDVNQADARGTVEYTNRGTTVITTRSISRLDVFATFPTAA